MSQDLDTIRAAYEGAGRGDWTRLLESLDPEVEWHNPDNAIEPGVRQGKDSFKVGLERFLESVEVEIERIAVAGDQVVVLLRMEGQGRASGIPLNQSFGHVIEMRNGKLIRFAWFTEQAEALEAAGLAE